MSHATDQPEILLLDDDPLLRQTILEILSEYGFAAIGARDEAEAKAVLTGHPSLRILVADRSLGEAGGRTGFALAAEALERFPRLRVIYTTGLHQALERRVLGPRERVLPKPFAASQLVALIRHLR